MIEPRSFRRVMDKTYVQLRSWKFRKNQIQKIPVSIDSSRYRVETISQNSELEQVLHLRYQVFIREGLDKKKAFHIDIDQFDFISDHLCVFDKDTNEIVGTYRLLSDQFTHSFYSQTEFEISEFLKRSGGKLEMGRACIHPAHRNGMVIALLWKGISEYMEKARARYLFGCASFKAEGAAALARLQAQLSEKDAFDYELGISVLPKYQYPSSAQFCDDSEQAPQLSGLIRSYLKAGAKLHPDPAYDKAFKCFDFFTCIDLQASEGDYRRYGRK